MKRTANITKEIVLGIAFLIAAIFLWPFAVAGVLAFLASGMKFNRWISSGFALIATIVWRLAFGEWALRIGGGASAVWYLEAFHAVVNWALAAIFVSAFAHFPAMLKEGYRSTATKPA
jgi:hypothetical protein